MSNTTSLGSPRQLRAWKHLWDLFIGDSVFREYYTDTPSYDLDMKRVTLRTKISKPKGTLYIGPTRKKGREGHFIGYEMNSGNIRIFDPSGFAYQQFSANSRLANSVAQRSGKSVIRLENHPQDICTGDTFCQTWSIAWLKPNMRKLTQGVNTANKSVTNMYTIVSTIANSAKFSQYMRANAQTFDEFIRKECDAYFKTSGSRTSWCSIKNTEDFITASKKITRQDIERIMHNRL